jgi:hypothetical protein
MRYHLLEARRPLRERWEVPHRNGDMSYAIQSQFCY